MDDLVPPGTKNGYYFDFGFIYDLVKIMIIIQSMFGFVPCGKSSRKSNRTWNIAVLSMISPESSRNLRRFDETDLFKTIFCRILKEEYLYGDGLHR